MSHRTVIIADASVDSPSSDVLFLLSLSDVHLARLQVARRGFARLVRDVLPAGYSSGSRMRRENKISPYKLVLLAPHHVRFHGATQTRAARWKWLLFGDALLRPIKKR